MSDKLQLEPKTFDDYITNFRTEAIKAFGFNEKRYSSKGVLTRLLKSGLVTNAIYYGITESEYFDTANPFNPEIVLTPKEISELRFHGFSEPNLRILINEDLLFETLTKSDLKRLSFLHQQIDIYLSIKNPTESSNLKIQDKFKASSEGETEDEHDRTNKQDLKNVGETMSSIPKRKSSSNKKFSLAQPSKIKYIPSKLIVEPSLKVPWNTIIEDFDETKTSLYRWLIKLRNRLDIFQFSNESKVQVLVAKLPINYYFSIITKFKTKSMHKLDFEKVCSYVEEIHKPNDEVLKAAAKTIFNSRYNRSQDARKYCKTIEEAAMLRFPKINEIGIVIIIIATMPKDIKTVLINNLKIDTIDKLITTIMSYNNLKNANLTQMDIHQFLLN